MKNRTFAALALIVATSATLALTACNNPSTAPAVASPTPTAPAAPAFRVSPADAQTAAQFATSTALSLAVKSDSERTEAAQMAYAAASALNGLATGQSFTPDQVSAKLSAFGGVNAKPAYLSIASGVSAVWSSVYPSIKGNGQVAATYLAALAAGIEAGAAPFLPAKTTRAVAPGGPVVTLNGVPMHRFTL